MNDYIIIPLILLLDTMIAGLVFQNANLKILSLWLKISIQKNSSL
jgi:hypothetical protein